MYELISDHLCKGPYRLRIVSKIMFVLYNYPRNLVELPNIVSGSPQKSYLINQIYSKEYCKTDCLKNC